MLTRGLDQQAVDNHFDGVVLTPVELDLFLEGTQRAVDTGANEALLGQLLEILPVGLAPSRGSEGVPDGAHEEGDLLSG